MCLYMEQDWMTFTVWVDLVSKNVVNVTVYTVLLLCTDMDLKWISINAARLTWRRTVNVSVCVRLVSLHSVCNLFCLCSVTPLPSTSVFDCVGCM